MAMMLSSMRRFLSEELIQKLPSCYMTLVLSATCGAVWAAYNDKRSIRRRIHDAARDCGVVSERFLVKQEAVNAEMVKLVKEAREKMNRDS